MVLDLATVKKMQFKSWPEWNSLTYLWMIINNISVVSFSQDSVF
jgi:hypothetical protein